MRPSAAVLSRLMPHIRGDRHRWIEHELGPIRGSGTWPDGEPLSVRDAYDEKIQGKQEETPQS